jgi:hypothetical protein
MTDDLHSPLVDLSLATDLVEIRFPKNKRKNVVLFAHEGSDNPHLRRIHQFYRKDKDELARELSLVPKNYLHPDDLAGGVYLPYGLGSIPPGPKGCPKSWRGLQIPYLRRTARSSAVRRVFHLYGKVLGALSEAIEELCPDIFRDNQQMGEGAQDCIFPEPKFQWEGRSIQEEGQESWFCNQCIIRSIGLRVGTHSLEDAEIAMHFDASDYPSSQPLMFWPMGGLRGCGGQVKNTDLLVFEDQKGGHSFRVRTAIEDVVVIVLMNSSEQLHAGAGEDVPAENFGSWSARFVPYCRGPIMKFINERRKCKTGPSPFVNLPRYVKGDQYTTTPLDPKEFVNEMTVAVQWGKKKKKWFHATLYTLDDGTITLEWQNGEKSLDWKGKVFDHECASSLPDSD